MMIHVYITRNKREQEQGQSMFWRIQPWSLKCCRDRDLCWGGDSSREGEENPYHENPLTTAVTKNDRLMHFVARMHDEPS